MANTALRNSAWTNFWGWAGAGDELGAYAASSPVFGSVGGQLYISSGYGPAYNHRTDGGTPVTGYPTALAISYGYRPELGGIFTVSTTGLVRATTFAPEIWACFGVVAHPSAPASHGGVAGLGWDYDQWAIRGDGVLGAPVNNWSYARVPSGSLQYITPVSVNGELILYPGDAASYAFVQETREVLFAILRPDGKIGLHRFPASTFRDPTLSGYFQTVFNVDGNTRGDQGTLQFGNIAVDDAGQLWVTFEQSQGADAGTLYLAHFSSLADGAVSLSVIQERRNTRSSVGGNQSFLLDANDIWVVSSTQGDDHTERIVRINKTTGVRTVEFTTSVTNLNDVFPGFLRWQGRLYTDAYFSRVAERQYDGSWIWETENPEAPGPAPVDKLFFDILRIVAWDEGTIYAIMYDDRPVGGMTPTGFDPTKGITRGVTTFDNVGGAVSYPLYLAYIDKSSPNAGPFRPQSDLRHRFRDSRLGFH